MTIQENPAAPKAFTGKFWVCALAIGLLALGLGYLSGKVVPVSKSSGHARSVDLKPFLNAQLNTTWLRSEWVGNHLGELPTGEQELGGVHFDVQGILQLQGAQLIAYNQKYPVKQTDIPLNRRCSCLHLLHGCAWSAEDGTPIGLIVLHYEDNSTKEFVIMYGVHVRDYYQHKPSNPPGKDSVLAWSGTCPATKGNEKVRLFRSTFLNPAPDKLVRSLDYVSLMASPAPFMIALSVE